MLAFLAGVAFGAVPTATGVGDLVWGSPAGGNWDPCLTDDWSFVPAVELFGVTPDGMSAGFPGGKLTVVMAPFLGKAKGDQIRVAVTRALGPPFQTSPDGTDLYWYAASKHVLIRMETDANGVTTPAPGTVILSMANVDLVVALRYQGDEPEWWEITPEEVKSWLGLGPAPVWSGTEPAPGCVITQPNEDPLYTPISGDALRHLAEAQAQTARPTGVTLGQVSHDSQIVLDDRKRDELKTIVAQWCGQWPSFGRCKQAKADLAKFEAEHPNLSQ